MVNDEDIQELLRLTKENNVMLKEVKPFSEFGEDAELLNEWSKKLEECFESSEEKMLVLFLNDILKRRWK